MHKRTAFILLVMFTVHIIILGGFSISSAEPLNDKLKVAIMGEISTLDPSLSTANQINYIILTNFYDPLVASTDDGKPMQGGLSNWTISQDGKSIEFTIRKGVKFSNGDPLTANDVLFTHERHMKGCPQYISGIGPSLDKVEVVNDYVIRFTFKQPRVRFMWLDAPSFYILSKAYHDRVGEDEFVKNPIGSGPYKFVEWKKGQYLDLEANDNYWGPKPQVKQARILFVREDTTRVAMLKTGEADIIRDTPWQNVKQLQEAGYNVVKIPSAPNMAIRFQTFNPNVPWYDKRVRQAVAYAIDRKAIVNNLFFGVPGLDAWLAPNDLGYDPALKPYPYDPEKAKSLLAEAGYPKGFDMPFYFTIAMPGIKDVADAVALYLKAVNINCQVQGVEGVTMQTNIRRWHGDTSASVVQMGPSGMANFGDVGNSLSMGFYSKSPQSLYNNPEIDKLIDKALATWDDTKRGEIYKQILRAYNEDMPVAMILSNCCVFTMKSNVIQKPTVTSSGAVVDLTNITVK